MLKRLKTYLSHKWLGHNFDFFALFCISIPVLTLFFTTLPSGTTVYFIIENHALLIGALLGFPILIKRVGEIRLQSRTMQYNTANELLWSKDQDSRMAGINAFWRLADDYPKEEYHNVMDVFSQFIKHPAPYEWEKGTKEEDKKAGERKDINAILRHIVEERMIGAKPYKIDLRGTHLEGADLSVANLKRANLRAAHLEGVCLWGANLEGADLTLAVINEVDFTGAKNLTQEQINSCVFIADLFDAKKLPTLPEGMNPTYREMTHNEWERQASNPS